MLVLSRRESEQIKLGDSIVVTVVRVAGSCPPRHRGPRRRPRAAL